MRRKFSAAIVATLLSAISFVAPAHAQKKRVAVFDFEYATVQGSVSSVMGANVDIGKGIADMIVEELVKSGTYSVVDRKALDKILAEQNFSNSDRADANTAAKIGKILGVDGIIIGSITQFGADDKSTNVSGGALSKFGGRIGIGGVSRKESKAVVNISARLVGTETAEIYAVASGKGEAQRSGTGVTGSGSAGVGNLDMQSANFRDTIIGEAVNKAVTTLTADLNGNADKVVGKKVNVEGLVADATGSVLVLNMGSKAGAQVGMKLAVKRTGREIKDPATGKVIRRIEEAIGEVTLTDVDPTSSVGNFKGAGTPKVGDRVATPE
jgi:curli biogenesis system outer membrane secretion channel CsgG